MMLLMKKIEAAFFWPAIAQPLLSFAQQVALCKVLLESAMVAEYCNYGTTA
jgi:hypothetical protein